LAFLFANKGFVNLHDFSSAAHGFNANNAHGLMETVRHEPCGLESDAQGAVKLVTRNALLGRAHEVCGLKPIVHRHMARLKDGPNFYGERLAALVALVGANTGALAAHLRNSIDCAAVWASRAVRPQSGFNPTVSSGFAMEGLGVNDRS
jgi:hypothetical protein